MKPEQLAKLPKWAQREMQDLQYKIKELERQRDIFLTEQETSPVYIDQGFQKVERRYINSRRVCMEHMGVNIQLTATKDDLRLYWNLANRKSINDYVTFVPVATNAGYFIVTRQIKE